MAPVNSVRCEQLLPEASQTCIGMLDASLDFATYFFWARYFIRTGRALAAVTFTYTLTASPLGRALSISTMVFELDSGNALPEDIGLTFADLVGASMSLG